jgi:hypothetical protein
MPGQFMPMIGPPPGPVFGMPEPGIHMLQQSKLGFTFSNTTDWTGGFPPHLMNQMHPSKPMNDMPN